MADKKPSYTVGPLVPYSQVPNWARRPPKWDELIEMINQLEPEQTLPVTFTNHKEAIRARNTVRDTVNREHAKAVIRTRMVEEEGKTTVFFTMLPDQEE